MKQSVINQMTEIVQDTMKSFQSDFEIDKKSLKDYDGKFIWTVAASHTHLAKIGGDYILDLLIGHEDRGVYAMLQRNFDADAILSSSWCCEDLVFYYDGKDDLMVEIQADEAQRIWDAIRDSALCSWKRLTKRELPKSFKVPVRFSCGRKYVLEQLRFADSIGDKTLRDRLEWFHNYLKINDSHYIQVGRDFTEHSFTFTEIATIDGEERVIMNGGILYYSGAWHRHT